MAGDRSADPVDLGQGIHPAGRVDLDAAAGATTGRGIERDLDSGAAAQDPQISVYIRYDSTGEARFVLWRNRLFVLVALAYALVGGLVGLAWATFPSALSPYAPLAHAHLMLVGFVGMMIFGIGLHVLPRFSGRPLYSERLADVQFALTNAGLITMCIGWLARISRIVPVGGAGIWIGLLLFTANVVLTIRPWARR